jgi:hypothetical protein
MRQRSRCFVNHQKINLLLPVAAVQPTGYGIRADIVALALKLIAEG